MRDRPSVAESGNHRRMPQKALLSDSTCPVTRLIGHLKIGQQNRAMISERQ